MYQYTRKGLSEQFDIGKETLRYYEKINLLPIPARNESGYRVYSEEDVSRIKFILQMKNYGFSLREIADLIEMVRSEKRADKDMLIDNIDNKITEVENQIREFYELIELLNRLKEKKNLGECDFFKSIIKDT
ncbi:MerR family transcriptional regulator [Anaerosacchariphilus polymeriproducens]|uniref:MerR family transcriptional regulator n=1 Tax=Anaerosacchariphilus polymeriproducens TaxID=1812858 RepID=A0A371AQM4_9FIRM|nr:MerR family transcriptional regulator [Anaerosacchariphilus polymeriproducens]RDU21881.1 MerR family transcriptional regulator [Anaerosacchariphilus polymeriproducens]